MTDHPHRFPSPWTAEDDGTCFIEAARIGTARRADRCKRSEVLAAETEEGPATG
jgi:hypothetical protein